MMWVTNILGAGDNQGLFLPVQWLPRMLECLKCKHDAGPSEAETLKNDLAGVRAISDVHSGHADFHS